MPHPIAKGGEQAPILTKRNLEKLLTPITRWRQDLCLRGHGDLLGPSAMNWQEGAGEVLAAGNIARIG